MKKILSAFAIIMVCSGAMAMDSGVYETFSNSSDQDIIVVDGKNIILETSRQVANPRGSIYFDEIVSYPAFCRYKSFAKISDENDSEIFFDVKYVSFVSSRDDREKCLRWIEEYKGMLALAPFSENSNLVESIYIRSSVKKSSFRKVQ